MDIYCTIYDMEVFYMKLLEALDIIEAAIAKRVLMGDSSFALEVSSDLRPQDDGTFKPTYDAGIKYVCYGDIAPTIELALINLAKEIPR